jgi:hypothetical protein
MALENSAVVNPCVESSTLVNSYVFLIFVCREGCFCNS